MGEPLIPGGCILLARKIIESEIWDKPPLYIKVWVYLLTRAQHSNYKGLRRGQVLTSIPEIIHDVSWRIGARVERPTKDQVFQILEFLRGKAMKSKRRPYESNSEATAQAMSKQTMITTTKATHNILITIDNYAVYQDLKSYESNAESNDEDDDQGNDETAAKATRRQRQPDNINKNDKNVKNDNKEIYIIFDHWNTKKIVVHRELTDATKKALNARLQVHPPDVLLKAIDNYNECLLGDEYFWTHKFNLKDFMNPKNLDRFLSENNPFDNFRDKFQKNKGSSDDVDQWVRELEEERNGHKTNR